MLVVAAVAGMVLVVQVLLQEVILHREELEGLEHKVRVVEQEFPLETQERSSKEAQALATAVVEVVDTTVVVVAPTITVVAVVHPILPT